MTRIPTFLTLVVAALLASDAAAKSVIVAVFDIEDQTGRFSQKARIQLTDYFSAQLATGGRFKVVPRSQLKARLKEDKKASYKACFDEKCQIEIGRELAAQKSLATKIIQVGTKCALMTTLFDLRTSTSEAAASQKARCDEDELVTALEKVAAKLRRSGSGARFAEVPDEKPAPARPPAKPGAPAAAGPAPSPAAPAPATEPPAELPAQARQQTKVAAVQGPAPGAPAAAPPPAEQQQPPPADTGGKKPVYKKWWFWTIIGVAVVGATVGIAVAVSSGGEDTTNYSAGALHLLPAGEGGVPLGFTW
jgi:hypothetical protein